MSSLRSGCVVCSEVPQSAGGGARGLIAHPRRHDRGRKRARFRAWIWAASFCFVLIIIVGGLFAAVHWRLTQGPIALNQMIPMIEDAIVQRIGEGYRLKIKDAVIHRDKRRGVYLDLAHVRLWTPNGQEIATVRHAKVSVDGQALLLGTIVPRELELFSPAFNITYDHLGALVWQADTSKNDVPLKARSINQLLERVLAKNLPEPHDRGAGLWRHLDDLLLNVEGAIASLSPDAKTAQLVRLGFTNGQLRLIDARSQKFKTIADASLFIDRRGIGKPIEVSFSARGEGDRRWSVSAVRHPGRDGEPARLEADFRNVKIADVLSLERQDRRAIAIDVPLNGRFAVKAHQSKQIVSATLQVNAGAGTVGIGGNDHMALKSAQLDFFWDKDLNAIQMNPSRLSFADHRVQFWGTIGLIAKDSAEVTIETGPIETVHGAGPLSWPQVQRLGLRGRYVLPAKALEFDWLTAQVAEAQVEASGAIGFAGPRPKVHLTGKVAAFTVATLKSAWPTGLEPKTRAWITRNVSGGRVREADFTLFPVTAEGHGAHGLDLSVDFAEVTLKAHPDLAPLQGASGTISVKDRALRVEVNGAKMAAPGGGRIVLSDGLLTAADLDLKPPLADLTFSAKADLPTFMRLVSAAPINEGDHIPLKARDISGQASARVHLSFPLIEDPTGALIAYNIDLQAADVTSRQPIDGFHLTQGRIALSASRGAHTITGTARINGIPSRIFIKRGHPSQVHMTLDARAREAMGISLHPLVRGTVDTKMVMNEASCIVTADLTGSVLALPQLGWHKPRGVAATATFRLDRSQEKGLWVNDLEVKAPGLAMRGALRIHGNGIVSGTLPLLSVNRFGKVQASFVRDPSGAVDLTIKGARFDARPHMRIADAQPKKPQYLVASGDAKVIRVKADVARVVGFNGEVLNDVSARMTIGPEGLDMFNLDGITLQGGRVSAVVARHNAAAPPGKSLQVVSSDFGSLLRFGGLYRNMRGGDGELIGQITGKPDVFKGDMVVSRFHIVDEPVLKRFAGDHRKRRLALTDSRANSTINAYPQLPVGPGSAMKFSKTIVRLRHSGNRLYVNKAILRGPVVGGVVSGVVNTLSNTIAFDGTIVPAYGINNILGKITGGGEGGLFGLNFSLSGTMAKPKVQVNPLSMIAPGFVREIFSAAGRPPRPALIVQTPSRRHTRWQ